MLRAASASLALHVLLLGGLGLWMSGKSAVQHNADQGVKVELVLLEKAGAGPPSSPIPPIPPAPLRAPPAEAAARASEAPRMREPPPPPPRDTPAAEPLPLRPAAPPAQPAAPPASFSAPPGPRRNLGGTDSPSNAIARGDNVIPAQADARYRNRPPVYPAEAQAKGQQGAVTLLIHVSPAGLPVGVEVIESSGFLLLDRAAREAVETWHFLPALRDGEPVAADMPLRVRFELDGGQ
jgi:periplasmic protein TonB